LALNKLGRSGVRAVPPTPAPSLVPGPTVPEIQGPEPDVVEAVAVQEDRIFGFIKSRGLKFFCFVSDGKGNEVFAHRDDWKCSGGHHCHFNVGAKVSYKVVLNENLGKNKAVEVRLLHPPDISEFEEATVFNWRGRWGFAERPCGCHLHVHMNDVLSDVDSLKVGDRIWLSAEADKDVNGRFRYAGRNIEVFKPEFEVNPDPQKV
jgi:hypothetical protein